MLAGISADYYLRLERGRATHPSAQVLDAIARVLRLDDEQTAHLHALAAPAARPSSGSTQPPPSSLTYLVDSLPHPAYLERHSFTVVAANALARALDATITPGANTLRELFLERDQRALYPQWEQVAACMVSSLRRTVGGSFDDPEYAGLIGELTQASTPFRELWATHEVAAQRGASIRFDHPLVGPILLDRERLDVSGSDGLTLVVFHPAARSEDAEALALLAASIPAQPRSFTPTPATTARSSVR